MKISLVFILFVVVQAKDFIIHKKQFVLNQGLILGTLDVLRKEHTIIFKVYPKSYSKGWKSVFHLTQGKDYGAYGDRIPGVWFHDDGSGKLSIFTAVNGNNNYYVATAPLPLNQWSSVKICQSVHNGKYWYSVDLNGINIHRVENSDARDFQNIIVYASDPWYAAQNALISNIIIVNGNIETIIGSVPANLVKGKLIAEIPKLDKEYLVSFDIYPNKFVAGWHSVIHFSIGSDYGRYGDRTPGIWFHTDGKGGLYISAPINGNVDRVFTTNPIGLNHWSSVEVSQFLRNSVYIYTIRINEEIVFSEINNLAQSFDNVKVYASDPWYDAQYGSIRNLFVVNGVSNNGLQAVIVLPTDFIDDASKIVVKKNFLVATLLILKKQFSVSFEVKPTLYQTGWHSVFHMTIGQDIENYGDRIPGVWFHDDGSGKLLIAFAINGNKNYHFTTASSLPLNQWSKIEISQRLDSFIYVYEVSLNGVVIFTIQNNDARDFKNVKVYLGDPWYSAQAGSVKNLKIFNKI